MNLLSKTASMQGFNALDEWGRFDEAFDALSGWDQEGLLAHRETVYEGLESASTPSTACSPVPTRQDAGEGHRSPPSSTERR